jgi:hypothetical protein
MICIRFTVDGQCLPKQQGFTLFWPLHGPENGANPMTHRASQSQSRTGERGCTMEFEGYCVKCRTKRTIKDGAVTKTSKGRPMAKGVCPECGTTVTRFLSERESKG